MGLSMRAALVGLAGLVSLVSLVSLAALQRQADASSVDPSQRPPELPLKGMSFTLNSAVTVIASASGTQRLEVEESYSPAQQRARIKYKTSGKLSQFQLKRNLPREGAFYVTDLNNVFLVDKEPGQKCRVSDKLTIGRLFHQDRWLPMGSDDHDDDGDEITGGHQPVGPARFLFYLDANRDKMRLSTSRPISVRNTPSVMYEFKSEAGYTFNVFYSKLEGPSTRLRVPLEARAGKAGEFYIIFDFGHLDSSASDDQLAWDRAAAAAAGWTSASQDEPTLDALTVPPAAGCAQLANQFNSAANLLKLDQRISAGPVTTSFSFAARAWIPNLGSPANLFVAYEGALSSMRVDRFGENKMSSLVSNHRLARAYHLMLLTNGRQSDHVLDTVLSRADSALDADDNPDRDIRKTCVVFEDNSVTEETSLGELLLGAGQLLYLGRAWVRGVPALAFEAHDTSWPIWFRQSIAYRHRSASGAVQARQRPSNQGPHKLSTVVYVAAPASASGGRLAVPSVDSLRLLRLDVSRWFEDDKSAARPFDRHTLEVTDFSWSLAAQGPQGQRASELFSVGQHCQSSAGDGQHQAEVAMLLRATERAWTRANKPKLDWLKRVQLREFALLAALQASQLGLPVTHVLDFRSRLDLHAERDERPPELALAFRLVEHDKRLAELQAMGRGRLARDYAGTTFKLLVAFQACYALAAHRRLDTYFGYDPARGQCVLDMGSKPNQRAGADAIAFETNNRDGPYELYLVRQVLDPLTPAFDQLTRLAHGKQRLEYLTSRGSLRVAGREPAQLGLELNIKSLRLVESSEKNSYQIDAQRLPDTNKFVGFGLLVSDAQNRRALPSPITIAGAPGEPLSELQTDMTFGQCQAACLADFGCESFSVCIRNGQLECVLSAFSFRRPQIVLKLMALQAAQGAAAKPNSVELLHVDDTSTNIHLRRSPLCELHNKIYLDLFRQPARRFAEPLAGLSLIAVTGREHCARLWFERALELVRNEVHSAGRIGWSLIRDPRGEPKLVHEALREHKLAAGKLSEHMIYLDAEQAQELSSEAREYLQGQLKIKNHIEDVTSLIDGYCAFENVAEDAQAEQRQQQRQQPDQQADSTTTDKPRASGAALEPVLLERHPFRYELFFERQASVGLKASKLSWQEQAILNRAHRPKAPAPKDYEWLRAFVERGDNNQHTFHYYDESRCAALCLRQRMGVWPACKSFSLQTRKTDDMVVHTCYLNTITLSEAVRAQRFDLIKYTSPNRFGVDTQTYHYDPRPGFVTDELNAEGRLWLVELGARAGGVASATLGLLAALFLLKGSLLLGVLLGVQLANWYLRGRAPSGLPGESDTSTLVERPAIEFRNLVNFEGQLVAGGGDDDARSQTVAN